MQNNEDFLPLKSLFDTFDWVPITQILGKSRFSRRGRKKVFKSVNLFRAFVLKSYLSIDDNTSLVKRLKENKAYLEFCGLTKVPSHDVLSKFEKKYCCKFLDIFELLDDILEKNNVFEYDEMSFDGTDIPVLTKNKQNPHRYHFGAKSNRKKFHGFWLMILASVKHQIPRRFTIGYAREGQINLAKELFNQKQIDESKNNNLIIMDGIFDFKEMHEIIISIQHKIPLIAYNKRRSVFQERINLPSEDWHFELNPIYKNNEFVIEEFKKRTSIERVNSHSKMYTPICLIQNKIKKSHTIKKTTVETIICFAFILEQFKLLSKIRIKQVQKELSLYSN
ncbi:transposase [Candidatus Woesearchaeota archaeon]|nr:transposase [Candidatus Woesearchaeota archaeon]